MLWRTPNRRGIFPQKYYVRAVQQCVVPDVHFVATYSSWVTICSIFVLVPGGGGVRVPTL